MRKGVRRFLWFGVTVVVLLAGVVAFIHRRSLAIPDWYLPSKLTEAERREAAGRAVKKVETFTGAFAQSATAERRNEPPAPPVEATFTEDEIDGYFDIWLDQMQYREPVRKYVKDPAVRLYGGRMVIAGRFEKIDRIVSMHLRPATSEDGRVQVRLEEVTIGNQPVPLSMARQMGGSGIEKWQRELTTKLPPLQAQAAFGEHGVANSELREAWQLIALDRLVRGEAADVVLFLPVYGSDAVAVHCEAIAVMEDRKLQLRVTPMTAAQREAFLAQVKSAKTDGEVVVAK